MNVARIARSDVVLAAVVAGSVLIGAVFAPPGRTGLDLFGYLLLLIGPAALVVRRQVPSVVLLITTVCVLGYLLRGYPGVAAAVPVMVALFTAARSGGSRLVMLAPIAALIIVVGADLTVVHGQPWRQVFQERFLLAGWLVASVGLGAAFRQWGAYIHEADQRAADAERSQEETARRRAGEERLRIARELHDSLTHSISIIKVQAGVAIHLATKRGEEVPAALLAVREASGEAMRELRATLEVLRESDDPCPPWLARLDELVARAGSVGLPVTVTTSGRERALPVEVDQAAFRIVQEALTNVSRHAGPASASVRIDYAATGLTVQVDDDGQSTGAAVPGPGVGLIGMRERVAALGGRFQAGPRPVGGFTVRAELPLHDASPRSMPPVAGPVAGAVAASVAGSVAAGPGGTAR